MMLKLLNTTLLLCLFCLASSQASAQSLPQWGNLKPGPYAVGFKVVNTYDYARGYYPKVDFRGHRTEGESARPMQIAIWYPAEVARDAKRMNFGEYLYLRASNLGARPLTEELKQEARGAMRGPFSPYYPQGITDAEYQRVIETPTAVVKDAAPLKGSFPLVIHCAIAVSAQSVLLEYLASYGYVVAMVPMIGASPAYYDRGEWSALSLQTLSDDIGFLYSQLRQFPNVDHQKVSVIGAIAALGILFEMRNLQLNSIAVLEGSFEDEMKRMPGFDLTRMRIPLLNLASQRTPESELVNSLRYAERYDGLLNQVSHAETYQFPRVAKPEKAAEHVGYDLICQYTLKFLDATLKQDASAKAFLKRSPEENGVPRNYLTMRVRPALPPVPSESEFIALARQPKSIEEVRRVYQEVKQREPTHKIFTEETLTRAARFYSFDGHDLESIELFKLVVDAYPNSTRTHNYLAQLYQRVGQREAAIQHYEKVLALLPHDSTLAAPQKEALQKELAKKVSDLKGQK